MRRVLTLLSVLVLALSLVAASPASEQQVQAPSPDIDPVEDLAEDAGPTASGFTLFKLPTPQPVCSGLAFNVTQNPYFSRDDCGFGEFALADAEGATSVQVQLAGTVQDAADQGDGTWRFQVQPTADWPAGELEAVVLVDDEPAGSMRLSHNALGASVTVAPPADGDAHSAPADLEVSGEVFQLDATSDAFGADRTGVPASFDLAVDGEVVAPGLTAGDDGTFNTTLEDVEADVPAGETARIAVAVVNAVYEDPSTGAWEAAEAGRGSATFATPADTLVLHNRFVSSTGWVQPGETYPSRIVVENTTGTAVDGPVTVTVQPPSGTTFVDAEAIDGGAASVDGGVITWTLEGVPSGTAVEPMELTLVATATAATTEEDPRVVWKDVSSTATLEVADAVVAEGVQSHGPKVIPPAGGYETARYGDKPFPIVPVEFVDRSRQPHNTMDGLDRAVNDADFPGSMFNLYQEMSYGQLYPEGEIPSAGIAHAGFDYEPGFDFTDPEVGTNRSCRGVTFGQDGVEEQAVGSPVYADRIVDGWYQLPGSTEYYGGDFPAFSLGIVGTIDSACGQLGKGVYDAAQIADPEIDYDQFDSDKDGVVDFFMLMFNGCGGNGASQIPILCPYDNVPYDNIWPHSSSLEMQYTDPDTGLRGYVTDDQLTSHTGVPQCWVDEQYLVFDDCQGTTAEATGNPDLPTFVRVGPYNVNPETAIESASVISHEYGHHLDLPDFYSSYQAYADFNLMAADFSQHMTIFSKQELGWVVPEPIQPGETVDVTDWQEVKTDTGEIHWQTPEGEPYTLSEEAGDQNVHNGQAYRAGLEPRILLDETSRPEGNEHVWYSGRGNDFGCAPTGAHNLDVLLTELGNPDIVPEGSAVTLEFSSSWDIEWDWDYGFLLTSPDGANFTSQPSEQGYTTSNVFNPNSQQCFTELDNGLTGTSTVYEQGEPFVTAARAEAAYTDEDDPFLTDTYDISELVGTQTPLVRFSYFTDAAFDRPGWFIDDIVVTATTPDGEEIEVYASDFEDDEEHERLFPGGCDGDLRVAAACTDGWTRIAAGEGADMDHAYYLELRDQTGFDYDGHGQSDRGDTSWDPGLLIEYTDEAHGYGNNGVPLPPAQHYLDSQPVPGQDCVARTGPDNACADASFTARDGDTTFSDAVNDAQPEGWIDNFEDPNNEYDDDFWHFDYQCLTADVLAMEGEGIGPAPTEEQPLRQDLTANVTLTGGDGCQPFAYGRTAGGEDPAENTPPEAVATASPTEATVGETVTFDGSGSSDAEDTEDLQHEWDLGDGTKATGATVEHAYDEAGTYEATLTVTDSDGATDTDTVMVTVTEEEPPGAVRIECDDPAVDRSDGWTDEESEDATDGRYCQGKGPRGPNAGDHLEVAFTGTSVTLEHGVAPNGSTATVTIDGDEAGEVSFHGDGEGNDPTFGHEATFDGLDDGDHVLRLEVTEADGRQRFAYVDSLVADGFASTGSESTSDGDEVGAAGRTAPARAAGASTPVGTMALAVLLVALTMALHLRRLAAGPR